MSEPEIIVTRAGSGAGSGAVDADPITTEIVRHSLDSAANQMKRALVRTAFSPIIYEVLDFAVALYDRDLRLLAQAPSLPHFMGTLSFCIEAAVEASGGEDALGPGDVILYNWPYGTGSHQQDVAMVMPAFLGDTELVGYAAIKGHWLDIGGKAPYSTDTVDVFQEGTTFPGIKLYRGGVRDEDIHRTVLANSRLPRMVAGDMSAQVSGVRAGTASLIQVVERFGLAEFKKCTERMFDHGEAIVRNYFANLPDGRYVGNGMMDNNGLDDEPIPFEVVVEIDGSTVRVDYSGCPDMQAGPVNCPLPETVSATRIALSVLAGDSEAPNEGQFRPLEVITRKGSLFHPVPPAPCFLYGWPSMQAMDVIYDAIAKAMPEAVPAWSGGDICALLWWGVREKTGEPWADGSPHPVGQGGHTRGDGGTMMHICESATRFSPIEVWEARNPWLLEKVELVVDSCGPGEHRGGLGMDMFFHVLEDSEVTVAIERTKCPPWGFEGGKEGRANGAAARRADGTLTWTTKATGLRVPKGDTLELYCGGGGGYGPPAKRPRAAVLEDLAEGYISDAFAREHYPHAFEEDGVRPAAE